MAKVYIETIPSASYSKTTWIDTGTTTYFPGDRVSLSDGLFVHGGGTIDNLHNRIYVCIRENNSQTYPFQDATNWVLAGSSEEHPCYAVDGSTCTTTNNEVYLENEANRYSGLGNNRFTWNQATAQGTEHGELIFADGEYNDNQKGFTIDKLSFTAKNKGKVTINTVGQYSAIFQGNNASTELDRNALEVSMMTGIKFIISGAKSLHGNNEVFGFDSCIITDQGAGTAYTSNNFRVGNGNSHLNVKNTVFNLPNTALKLVGYQAVTHRGNLFQIKNSTFYMGEAANQYTPLTLGTNTGLEISKCIFAFITSTHTSSNSFRLAAPPPSKDNLIYCYDSSVPAPAPDDGTTDGVCIVADPLFINRESGDLRLRPSSPVIGGIASKNKQSEVENQYPQGKWFDSNAAAGGDGSWETPYNNYGEAINSFTGDEAVVLIKEGQHPLLSGSPDSSGVFSQANDLLKVYSNGIKFIGMGSGSVFDTSSDGIKNYGAFWSSGTQHPNSRDTPFLFKDLDILLNNTGYINRGMICCRRAEYVGVNVTQALNLGATNSQLFDYTTESGSGDTGEYLKMSGCTVNVSLSSNTSNTSFLVGQGQGLKQFSSCTFVDLNRTTSMIGDPPTQFVHASFGTYAGSYIKDCILYANNSHTTIFGNQYSSDALDVKNVVAYNAETATSVSNKWSDNVSTTDPKFVATEPHDFDLRLRANSPLIGGLKAEPSNVYYLQPGNPLNGDGSQKDTSAMSVDGDPGPFNDFNKILAAGVPYGSKIIILNGTYPWPDAFHTQKSAANFADFTYEGYSYHAETPNKVIFDASNQGKCLGHYTLGGVAGSGTNIDLNTSFNGVQFNRSFRAQAWPHNTTAIFSTTDTLGKGSLTFNSCKFLGWIQGSGYNWTGGSRSDPNSSIHWNSCTISIAWENDNGSLLGGQDGLANDNLSTNWSWTNCVFYSPHGETTFYGNNAPNGTYFGPNAIFGRSGMQSSRIFKGNILYVPGGDTTIAGTNNVGHWPQITNNALVGVDIDAAEQSLLNDNNNLIDVDPLFVDPSNNNFSLRPLSPLIGQG